jgi:RNA polymerase sigma-70 factor (ECF subfamily)
MTPGEFEQCVAAAKRGDEAAFTVLFRSVQPMLLRYLRVMGGPLAEDAAGDTWVSVVRGLDRFRGDEAGWRAWVFTIGHARLRDAQRRSVRCDVPLDVDDLLRGRASVEDVQASVEELFSTQEALEIIGGLPPDQAEVVFLRHVAGLDVAHTARVLGKKPGAVRVAAHRGLRRLEELVAASREVPTGTAGCNAIEQQIDL